MQGQGSPLYTTTPAAGPRQPQQPGRFCRALLQHFARLYCSVAQTTDKANSAYYAAVWEDLCRQLCSHSGSSPEGSGNQTSGLQQHIVLLSRVMHL